VTDGEGGMLGRIGRRDIFALVALGLAGVGIPLWLAAAAGAIGIPSNDDWVYMRAADSLFRTGAVVMPGHTAASIGQVVMVQPLLWLSGGSPWAFTAFGLVTTLIGVASTYLLARRFVGIGSAVMVVLLVEAFPGFAREAATFMTDVPAYALVMMCLLLGTRGLQGEGTRGTLVASIGVGLLGLSIREFAIAAPAAVLVAAWARNRADERVWLAGVSGIFAAGAAWVLIVAASIPGRDVPVTPDLGRLILLGPAFTTVAAVLLPAVALGVGRRLATFSPEQIILGAGLVGLAFVLPYGSLVGYLWMQNGLGGNSLLSGTRALVIDSGVWAISSQLASFAAILVAALALRWGQRNLARVSSLSTAKALAIRIARRRDGLLFLFLVAYAAELVVFSSVSGIFDRYLFLLVPATAILLLRGPAQPSHFGRSRALAHGAFAWLAASAFVIATNSFAYDAARYRGGEEAVAMGYDARTVDAGYEWVGYHATGAEDPGRNAHGLTWYEDFWSSFRPCAVLSNSPLDGGAFRLIRLDRSAYLQFLFFGPARPLYLYGALADGCPSPPAAVAAAQAP
jgi:4-amino-4-deoxy-L-arabinose transferase-like glycosyltransferase